MSGGSGYRGAGGEEVSTRRVASQTRREQMHTKWSRILDRDITVLLYIQNLASCVTECERLGAGWSTERN
jgi:hypothetical protein